MTNTRNPREAGPQTDRELAEMIAKFRTPPGFSWQDLANDIETALKSRRALPAADGGWRPISEAPRDGTRIRILIEGEVEWREHCPAALISGGWHRVSEKDKVLGWSPLPPLPVP